jgi:hypothetical protein
MVPGAPGIRTVGIGAVGGGGSSIIVSVVSARSATSA